MDLDGGVCLTVDPRGPQVLDAIESGAEPRSVRVGEFLLRGGDERLPAAGAPVRVELGG